MIKKLMKKPVLLLAAAVILLLTSTVGGTQAALTYYSENYVAEVTVSNIGVTLLENGETVDYRNYLETGNWDTKGTGMQTLTLLAEGETVVPGKYYDEALQVKNSGAIDTYVRVVITKSWKDDQGKKDTELTPGYIGLHVPEGNGWVKDTAASTVEREVYYYTKVLPKDSTDGKNVTPALTDTFRIDPAVAKELIQTTDDNLISYEYKYDGYECVVEVEVDAVQTHNAAEAIKSAWGVGVTVAEDGSISLK